MSLLCLRTGEQSLPMSTPDSPWPAVKSPADWDRVRGDDARLADGVAAILARHGVEPSVERFKTGSLPVYAVGTSNVLKLFPPHEADFQQTEAAALAAVHGRISIPTPEVVAADTLDEWPYILMTRCVGRPVREVWSTLDRPTRVRLMRTFGAAMSELHGLTGLPAILHIDWPRFIDNQRATAVARQRERGLASRWLTQIDGFLDRVAIPRVPEMRVLLHTELMQEHLLVASSGAGWRWTGLIDFEPSMVGDPGYELASVGLFVTEGDRELFAAVLEAYGRQPLRGSALAERCLAYALLHRYSHLGWYIDRLRPPSAVDRLEGLAEAWFFSP